MTSLIPQFTGNDTSLESGSVDVGRRGVLIFERGATFSASLLSVFGRTSLSGPNVSGTINGLSSAVVVYSGGELLINDGADLTSISTRNTIGSGDPEGPLALVRVAGDGSVWDAGLADIRIAISPSGRESGNGELRVEDGAIVRANRVLIGTGGVVGGNRGIVEADLFVLGGQLLPGNSPGLLTIDGDLNVDIDSTIVIEIAGTGSVEAYDVVDVTGDAIVDGMIVLKFIDGFAPTAGDQFEFLRVGGVVDLADTLFDVQGLQPGFEFEIMPTSSGMQVLALNNGVASVPEPSSFTIIALMLFTALQHSSRFSGQMCLHRSAS